MSDESIRDLPDGSALVDEPQREFRTPQTFSRKIFLHPAL
jgi:hypothetical protein